MNRLVCSNSCASDFCTSHDPRGFGKLDSFNLWKTVCSSKLLQSIQFILLLNKTDILDARLKAGIQFSSFVNSYKDENDLEHVMDCGHLHSFSSSWAMAGC